MQWWLIIICTGEILVFWDQAEKPFQLINGFTFMEDKKKSNFLSTPSLKKRNNPFQIKREAGIPFQVVNNTQLLYPSDRQYRMLNKRSQYRAE